MRKPRKSISIKGLAYRRLKNYCDAGHVSVSGTLETWIHEALDVAGVPTVEEMEKEREEKDKADRLKFFGT